MGAVKSNLRPDRDSRLWPTASPRIEKPIDGILGNEELLLVELRRKEIELSPSIVTRLDSIATFAVPMRETVRRLSEEWESNSQD